GWYVDSTPNDDTEFASGATNSPAQGRVDLLTVLMHEMGHVLGYYEDSDAADTVMSMDLPVGVRRVREPAATPVVVSPTTTPTVVAGPVIRPTAVPSLGASTAPVVVTNSAMGTITTTTPATNNPVPQSNGHSKALSGSHRLVNHGHAGSKQSVHIPGGQQEKNQSGLGSAKTHGRMTPDSTLN